MASPLSSAGINPEHDFDTEMGEFFDFDCASNLLPLGLSNDCTTSVTSTSDLNTSTALPPECVVIKENFGIEPAECQSIALDFSNFAKWIPRYSKPEKACDYCKSRHLECWFTFENQTGCSACCALFRPCSFTVENSAPSVMMDTLHVVKEDQVQDSGELTGLKALRSWDRTALDNPDFDDDDRPTRRSSSRFSKEAIIILRKWMDAHKYNPYPTEEEKEDLQNRTGLTSTQISNWLANTRRRNKAKKSRGVSPGMKSPTFRQSGSSPIPISRNSVHNGKTWEIMDPLERWKASPPENEPALVSDIANAVANSKLRVPEWTSHRGASRTNADSSESGSVSRRPPSVTSLETGMSESQQSSGSFSTHSIGSSRSFGSRNSLVSAGSGVRKDKRRRRKVASRLNLPSSNDHRPFQCTFCTDSFRTKYDWMRHEKSLHLTLEKWICAPLGGIIASTEGMMCVFCGEKNPSEGHLDKHNHSACGEKPIDDRTFYRKDHLRQHLRLVHGCKMIESMDSWKTENLHISSKCGFCEMRFDNWNDRCEHLSHHFRNGAKMKDWKGCRGLEGEVAKHVTNAMPAFLIGKEVNSPDPFSATNPSSMLHSPINGLMNLSDESPPIDQLAVWNASTDCPATMVPMPGATMDGPMGTWTLPPMESFNMQHPPPRVSTCWEVLTIRLGLYVRELQNNGIPVTDELLQRQARIILYDSDDTWNQTAADDEQWLELFKKAHGLPSTSKDINVDLMEDLGLGVSDLSFDDMIHDPRWNAMDVTSSIDLSGLVMTAGEADMFGMTI